MWPLQDLRARLRRRLQAARQSRLGKVDTEAQPELAQAFGIEAIPTVMVFRDGVLLFEQAGILPAKALDDLVSQVEKLDMVEVKKKVDEQRAAHAHEHGPNCKH